LICIDASLVLRTLVPGAHSDRAAAMLRLWQDESVRLVAPALLAFEVTSVLRRLVHLGVLTTADGEDALEAFLRMEIRLTHRRDLFPLAWRLARELERPRAYDTAYLAVARLNGCDLWTADERLFDACRASLPWVRWIGGED
jgi:predicted nucleic acid-binding protein